MNSEEIDGDSHVALNMSFQTSVISPSWKLSEKRALSCDPMPCVYAIVQSLKILTVKLIQNWQIIIVNIFANFSRALLCRYVVVFFLAEMIFLFWHELLSRSNQGSFSLSDEGIFVSFYLFRSTVDRQISLTLIQELLFISPRDLRWESHIFISPYRPRTQLHSRFHFLDQK